MFEALLMVVTLHGPMGLKDVRGPYYTEKACKARLVEMESGMQEYLATFGIVQVLGKCTRTGDTAV